MRLPALAVALLVSTAAQAQEIIPTGMKYILAREILLANGFTIGPVPPNADQCEYWDPEVCKTNPEVVECHGSREAGCEMLFYKGKRMFVINTRGEEINKMWVVKSRMLSRRESETYGGE